MTRNPRAPRHSSHMREALSVLILILVSASMQAMPVGTTCQRPAGESKGWVCTEPDGTVWACDDGKQNCTRIAKEVLGTTTTPLPTRPIDRSRKGENEPAQSAPGVTATASTAATLVSAVPNAIYIQARPPKGDTRSDLEQASTHAPIPPLSAEIKLQLLTHGKSKPAVGAAFSLQPYLRLSSKDIWHERGSLSFLRAAQVAPWQYATYFSGEVGCNQPRLRLTINSPSPGRYLIDFAISANEAQTLVIYDSYGPFRQTISVTRDDRHVAVVVDISTSRTQYFGIFSQENRGWSLEYVEVTRLN